MDFIQYRKYIREGYSIQGMGAGGDCTWAFKGQQRRKEQEELHLEKDNKSELKPQNRALVYRV